MNTGEFAKFCGVEKRTLFHYDKIGLLKPALVRENGYREYKKEQIYQMDMIKIFQASGYTLTEIKDIVNSDLQSRLQFVQCAQERIESQMLKLEQMHKYLLNRQNLLIELDKLPPGTHQIREETYIFDGYEFIDDDHYFNFLIDGAYDFFIIKENGKLMLCHNSAEGKFRKEGKALSFFLIIPPDEQNLEELIRDEIKRCQFSGEPEYYIENLPHFMLEDMETALIKVTVFEKIA